MFHTKISSCIKLIPAKRTLYDQKSPGLGTGFYFKDPPFPIARVIFLGMGSKGFFKFQRFVNFWKHPESADSVFRLTGSQYWNKQAEKKDLSHVRSFSRQKMRG